MGSTNPFLGTSAQARGRGATGSVRCRDAALIVEPVTSSPTPVNLLGVGLPSARGAYAFAEWGTSNREQGRRGYAIPRLRKNDG